MRKNFALCCFLLGTKTAYPSDLNVHTQAEMRLSYLEGVDKDKISLVTQTNGEDASSPSGMRTLGLTHFSLGLELRHRYSSLAVELRPDASLIRSSDTGAQNLEWDSRSGDVYQEAPYLNLLDLYELRFLDTDSYLFSYGVFDRVDDKEIFYSNRLEFGLRPQFPRKFSSVRFSWKTKYEDPQSRLEKDNYSGYQITLMTLENTNDRHEILGESASSDDLAPEGFDHQTGGALLVTWVDYDQTFVTFFAGYLDSKVTLGKKSRILASLKASTSFRLANHMFVVNFDSRYIQEKWSLSEGVGIPETVQTGHHLELVYPGSLGEKWFFSASLGSSDRPSDSDDGSLATYQGRQFILGYQKQIYDHLSLSVLLSDETRTKKEQGLSSGGFMIGDAEKKRHNRLLLEVSYLSHWSFD